MKAARARIETSSAPSRFHWDWLRSTLRVCPRGLVQRLVHELVGPHVLLPPDVPHLPAVELAEPPHGLHEQLAKGGVLDLVLAADLASDELGVVHHLDLAGAEVARQVERQQ